METNDKKAAGERAQHASGGTTNGATMPRPPVVTKASPNGSAVPHANGAQPPAADVAPPSPEPETVPNGAGLVIPSEYATAMHSSDVSAWLAAYDAIQSRTAEAHAVYQQTMAQCHLAFLHSAEQAALALASLATGTPISARDQRPTSWVAPVAPMSPLLPRPPARLQVAPPAGVASLAQAVVAPAAHPVPSVKKLDGPVPRAPVVVPPSASHVPAPVKNGTSTARAPAIAVVPPTPPRPAAPPAPSLPSAAPLPTPATTPDLQARYSGGLVLPADGDLKSFLFGIVADKTGYPVDVLNLDQQLEADLGIDSIKRVEILSAFEGQIENIQDINLEEVAKLNTLRDVLGFMERYADKLGLEKKK